MVLLCWGRIALSVKRILRMWWPLAASWLLMAVEVPLLGAVMARMANPELSLAAYGGVVYPISLIVEAPIIMLLSASTALSKDWAAYTRMRRFMWGSALILTTLHALIAFTPLYDLVARQVIGVPQAIVEPGRLGLMLMTPWTASIAYRRFQQGVMIRFGQSDGVGTGTIVRLTADCLGLWAGYQLGLPGIAVGSGAQALGVISEAIYSGWRVRPILNGPLYAAAQTETLTWGAFARFYVPLALTSLISLIWQPIGSAALSRMPDPVSSLAVWPVVSGLIFMLRSFGFAYNEVVVALLDETGSSPVLRRFAAWLAGTTTLLHLLIVVTPLSLVWFRDVTALSPELVQLARVAFAIALPLPFLSALQSWHQGAILYGRRTRGIPESMVVYLGVLVAVLAAGVFYGRLTGLYVCLFALVLANLLQTAWLGWRSREVMQHVRQRDAAPPGA